MRTRNRLVLLVCALVLLPTLVLAQAKLLRHPTYSNGKVAFSYLGDIWIANEDGTNIQRLTVHKARDIYPRFSPDGKWIAFSSNRNGNYDVFVMPITGGEPRQLTFYSGADNVVGWTPDSKKVVFQSARAGKVFPGTGGLWLVSIDGGIEEPIPTDWGSYGSYSADGSHLAFTRHPGVWWRKHYRGSYATDLWVMDVKDKTFSKLGDGVYKGNYFWPMYGNKGEIYFVADIMPNEATIKPGSPEVLSSRNNIWKISEKNGKPVQVTHHTDGNVFFPSISADGRVIVYEDNEGLWKLDTQSGKSTEIRLNIASDNKENPVETLTVRNEIEGYDLSPTTKRAAITVHGEIFTVATDKGDILRITETPARDSAPTWSPDGKWIAFVSDRSGRDEIWLVHEDATGLKQITDADTEKRGMEFAPDSKALMYTASDHKLYRYELETGKTSVVTACDVSNIMGARFSPDGKWVAYTKMDREMRPHVYIATATGGEEHHVADDDETFAETSPVWTHDGKKLLFLAGLFQSGMAQTRQNTTQLYSVALQKEQKALADKGVDSEEEAVAAERAARPQRGAPRGEEGAAPALPEVKIDFDGIAKRVHQITRLTDSVGGGAAVSPDSRLYAFVSRSDVDGRPISVLYTIADDGTQLNRVTTSQGGGEGEGGFGGFGGGGIGDLAFSKDGRSIFFREGGGLYSVTIPPSGGAGAAAPGRGGERKRVTFTARVEVNHPLERDEVFEESYRIMKHRFYDPKMHGADWEAARARYAPLIKHVADQEEMHNVILEMIGELNASHTGISAGPSPEDRDQLQTRYPGFELATDPSGFYKVVKVYKDGPADKDYVKLKTGDFILGINGHTLKAPDNYWKYYTTEIGQKLEFVVNSTASPTGAWKTKVEPVNAGAYTTLQYEDWVAQRKAMVEKLSNGEIGYLHIRAMDAPSLMRFQKDLVELHDKKALIIDQRFNGGGGIDQELLGILALRQYQLSRNRDSIDVTRPQRGFFGPMVVMANERSASDAEMFPDGFRTLGLGKVVGVTTYGAVIGTGSYRLLDGSNIRTPGSGIWNVKGYNLENYGVPPDVYVDNTPADFLQGRDAQLEKAVEVLKQDLQKKVPTKAAGQQ
jgi:tricorn protease